MLVFRCECEQVLGVDNAAGSGRLGECPSCGRIIRVPQGLSDAASKLRLSGTPSRAAASGPLREITEIPAPVQQNGQNAEGTNGSVHEQTTVSAQTPVAPSLPVRPQTPDNGEPVTLSPMTTEEVQETESAEELTPPPVVETETVVNPANKKTSVRRPMTRVGRAMRPGAAKSAPVTGDATDGEADPAAAVETLNAKGMGTLATAAAARRKRQETAISAAPKKSNLVMIVGVIVVLLLATAGVLYYLGIIPGMETAPVNKPPAVKTAPAATTETKPETTASESGKKETPADAEKKPDAPADKPGETKAEETKPTETK